MSKRDEICAICGCKVHREGDYAKPTVKGRSHATEHHLVAERFFGRTANRKGEKRAGIFDKCPWNSEGITEVFCYECHEELLHNPVFLKEDITKLRQIIDSRCLNESEKTEDRGKLAGRVKLLHEIIAEGLKALNRQ